MDDDGHELHEPARVRVDPDHAGELSSTRQRALEINIDRRVYGTFAEIGAGQEVARSFFQAGGASGTIAKTISAYDMQFSDSIYGKDPSGRYVTMARLERMLEVEYSALVDKVMGTRPDGTRYFAFADTVAAKRYLSDRECHGWMGLQFQHASGASPSRIVLHVRMLDSSNKGQQEALGILGVNLVYSAFRLSADPSKLLAALGDNIAWGRIEIDFIRFDGPGFEGIDNRGMNLALVTSSLGPVVMFGRDGEAVLPADLLHGKHVMVLRGTFRPFAKVHEDMIHFGTRAFSREMSLCEKDLVMLCEMNVARQVSDGAGEPDDMEDRIRAIAAHGLDVMVTSHLRYFRLSEYFARHEKRKIGFLMSVDNIQTIFDDRYYEGMEGGILEAMGKLFASDSKLMVYPILTPDGRVVTVESLTVPDHQRYLYQHLVHNRRIVPLHPGEDRLVPFAGTGAPTPQG